MKSISSLNNIHKQGLFGDFKNKDENNLIKIKEIKNIYLSQIVKFKNSKENLSNIKLDGLNLPKNLKSSSNSSTRIIWMGPENWYIFSTKDIFQELKKFNIKDFAITDLSYSRSIIELEGDIIPEVLKKGSPLNVNNLQEGDCANTVYNGITVTLDFVSDNPKIIRILGLRSFGESLYHSISDACLEFGYKAI
tara:strand:- start:592 stop:1170 length:579 start_codon:yes stop_codon:yes gene_type:complete